MLNNDKTRQFVDKFYKNAKKPCCAGCDYWRYYNSVVGDCIKSAPSSESERMAMIGVEFVSIKIGAGHVMTMRDHFCDDFIDSE